MPATVPGLRRDNVDVSRARGGTRGREREKEGESGVVGKRERGGEERYALLTKFQGVSRDFNVFSGRRIAPGDAARRGAARTP